MGSGNVSLAVPWGCVLSLMADIDMARFVVAEDARDVSVAWAVCVDLDKLRCEVTLLFLVSASQASRYAPT